MLVLLLIANCLSKENFTVSKIGPRGFNLMYLYNIKGTFFKFSIYFSDDYTIAHQDNEVLVVLVVWGQFKLSY